MWKIEGKIQKSLKPWCPSSRFKVFAMTTWTWDSCITCTHEHMCPIHSYVSHKYMYISHRNSCMSIIHTHYILHSSMHYQLNTFIHAGAAHECIKFHHLHACISSTCMLAHALLYILYMRMHAHVSHHAYLHMCRIHEWSWSVVHTCKCIRCMHAQALHTIIMHAAQISACVCDALDTCIKWWVRLCSPAFWNILQCKLCRWSAKISHYLVTLEHLNVLADHATPGAIVQWWNRSKYEPGRDERALHEMRMASYAALVQLLQQFVSCGATADLQEKGWWQDSKIVDRISEWVMGLETMRELCLVWLKRTSYIYPTTRSCRHAFAHSCRYERNCRPIQL